MIYKKISGATTDTLNSLLFKEFDKEKFYMAFLRNSDTWGHWALVKISLNNTLGNIVATTPNTENKFTTRSVVGYDDNHLKVGIYKTSSAITNFGSDDLTVFQQIPELIDYELSILYLNTQWAVIKGLPSDYHKFINTANNEKFYIIRNNSLLYTEYPDNKIAIAKIETKIDLSDYIYSESVVLSAVKDDVETLVMNRLTKSVNLLGEVSVEGADEDVYVEGYDEHNLLENYSVDGNTVINDTSNWPYFTLRNGIDKQNLIYDKMYLIRGKDEYNNDTIWHVSNKDKYMLFKASNSFGVEFFVRISISNADNGIGIYHESLPFDYDLIDSPNTISDVTPASLDITYLKDQSISSSLFELLHLVRIKKSQLVDPLDTDIYSKVTFVKELSTLTEKNKYLAYGFVENNSDVDKRIENIDITVDPDLDGYVYHYGNIRRNPNTISGNYPAKCLRLYLYNNPFIVGDSINIRYFDETHSVYDNNKTQKYVTVTGVSNQEDNYYIDLSAPTTFEIKFNSDSPDEEATNKEDASIYSEQTTVLSRVIYAVCDSYENAVKYNMNSVKIEMYIPKQDITNSMYTGLYRQIAICHEPYFFPAGVKTLCTSDVHSADLLNSTHCNDLGSVVFISNKTPIYRQFLASKELFVIII